MKQEAKILDFPEADRRLDYVMFFKNILRDFRFMDNTLEGEIAIQFIEDGLDSVAGIEVSYRAMPTACDCELFRKKVLETILCLQNILSQFRYVNQAAVEVEAWRSMQVVMARIQRGSLQVKEGVLPAFRFK